MWICLIVLICDVLQATHASFLGHRPPFLYCDLEAWSKSFSLLHSFVC